jgi:hypothetical protein
MTINMNCLPKVIYTHYLEITNRKQFTDYIIIIVKKTSALYDNEGA